MKIKNLLSGTEIFMSSIATISPIGPAAEAFDSTPPPLPLTDHDMPTSTIDTSPSSHHHPLLDFRDKVMHLPSQILSVPFHNTVVHDPLLIENQHIDELDFDTSYLEISSHRFEFYEYLHDAFYNTTKSVKAERTHTTSKL